MKQFLIVIYRFFVSNIAQDADTYLSNSTDLVDLERRQRNIQMGNAPFQHKTRLSNFM